MPEAQTRILVVDDDSALRLLLRDYLTHKAARDAGLRLVGSAEEGVAARGSLV